MQRKCLAECSPAGGRIARRPDGSMALRGWLPCGKRDCPNCGPVLWSVRRRDIEDAVARAKRMGYRVMFLTLTLRHGLRDRLEDTLDALHACFKGLLQGRAWQDLKGRHGIAGFIRVTECKHSCENGWHPHLHVLVFLDPARATAPLDEELAGFVDGRWRRLTAAAGFAAGTHGARLESVTARHLDRLSGYMTKAGDDDEELAGRMAAELTAGDLKTGRGRTMLALLDLAVAGDRDAARLWGEYEDAIRGRRFYSWSHGLREELAMAPEADEAAELEVVVAEQELGEAEELVELTRENARQLVARGLLEPLAQLVAVGATGEDLVWWLSDRGVDGTALPPPRGRPAAGAEPPWGTLCVTPAGGPAWLAIPEELVTL